jgi:hypothetical protein
MTQWKMAPRKPTKAMLDAAYSAHDAYEASAEGAWCGLSSAYRAMLTAAPEAPDVVGALERLLADIDSRAEAYRQSPHIIIRMHYNNIPLSDGCLQDARYILSQLKGEGA